MHPAEFCGRISLIHQLIHSVLIDCNFLMLQGILGQGSGKALEAKAAVDKATRKALKHLTYVPRFREHTIHYPITVLYGKTKVPSLQYFCRPLLDSL